MNRRVHVASLVLSFVALACRGAPPPQDDHHEESEGWAVTAWGQRYEIFAETDALVAGQASGSHVHVTVLADFSALESGAVSAVLRDSAGREQRFQQDSATRSGIFSIEVEPAEEGEFDLMFSVAAGGAVEEIAAGRVRVGSAASPGGLLASHVDSEQGVPFLKEQQWRTEFATQWAEAGALQESLTGPARVLPARGGEVVLTASVEALVAPDPWPYTGLDVAAGAVIFRLHPRATERSLPQLSAEISALEADAGAARKRVERLEELLRLEATSVAELERARAALAGIEARLAAARHGVAAVRGGAPTGTALEVTAPWAGRVADVTVSPGQSVSPGDTLGRLVKPRPLWIEVALRPEQTPQLVEGVVGLVLRRATASQPVEFKGSAVRLVAIAPEVDARTATVAAILEVGASASTLPIGSAVEAEVVLAGERQGVVVPESALVDDAGVAVVYVQDSGESFTRVPVRVLARQGTRVLLEGLEPGARLVTRGAASIRRSSLLSSGAPERHVH